MSCTLSLGPLSKRHMGLHGCLTANHMQISYIRTVYNLLTWSIKNNTLQHVVLTHHSIGRFGWRSAKYQLSSFLCQPRHRTKETGTQTLINHTMPYSHWTHTYNYVLAAMYVHTYFQCTHVNSSCINLGVVITPHHNAPPPSVSSFALLLLSFCRMSSAATCDIEAVTLSVIESNCSVTHMWYRLLGSALDDDEQVCPNCQVQAECEAESG